MKITLIRSGITQTVAPTAAKDFEFLPGDDIYINYIPPGTKISVTADGSISIEEMVGSTEVSALFASLATMLDQALATLTIAGLPINYLGGDNHVEFPFCEGIDPIVMTNLGVIGKVTLTPIVLGKPYKVEGVDAELSEGELVMGAFSTVSPQVFSELNNNEVNDNNNDEKLADSGYGASGKASGLGAKTNDIERSQEAADVITKISNEVPDFTKELNNNPDDDSPDLTTPEIEIDIDTVAPTVVIAMNDVALTIGETSTVTFTFSEAVTNFDSNDITAPNGSISGLNSTDGGITWIATFTPTANIQDTTNVISVGNNYTDIAGNAGTAASSPNYTIATAVTVSIAATTDGAELDIPTNGLFTVTLSQVSLVDTVVSYTVGGDAAADSDYTALTGTVTIAAGATTATIDVTVLGDNLLEADESVIVTLNSVDAASGAAGITVDVNNNVATVTITDEDTATVSIVATTDGVDPDVSGTVTDGLFTVTLSKMSSTATVVNYDVTGTADGTDYSIPMSVTIAAGQTSATITVDVTDDALIEGSETVVVTLTGTDNSDITALSGSEVATVTITDEDTATVSIVATTAAGVDPDGMGGSATDGIFTVTLSKASEIATVVNYDVTGTADGTDYSIPMSVTIAAGQTSATITVDVTDDALIEGSETVVVTLTGTDNSDITALSGSEVATVTITDEDTATVSIVATTAAGVDPDGMGGSATDGIFTVTLSKASEIATVVNYDVTGTADGTDYSIPMSVTIAAGQTSATITVDVTDDALIEGSETVVVTLTGTDNSDITALSGSEVATVTITDEDTATVSIVATTAAGVDPDGMGGSATDGIFTVTLSKASEIATVVNYDVTGTADGTDYSIPMSVTIAAGQTSATITVDVTDDALIEGSETVVVTLTGTDNSDITALSGSEVATVTITDEDTATVSIVATTAAGVDPDGMGGSATDGIFTVTLSKASEIATVVNYDVTGTADGTDYSIPMSVTIAAGQTSATITVDVTDDALIEGSETVVVTLTGTDNSDITALSGSEVATVTITDEDTATVSIVATTAAGVDPDGMGGSATDGIFTVTLSKASEIATVVNYDVTGTADGTDYSIPMSVTIAAGQTSATITVDVTDDALIEGSETVVVTLTGTDNSDITALSGSEVATVTITDEDTATVSIVATTAAGVDPDGMGGSATDGIFTVTLSKASEIATVVNYDVTGTADGTDYSIPMSVTIAAGQTSATITVDVTDDALIEGSETVVVTLTGTDNSDITALSGSEVATVTITDEDTATVSIVATTAAGVDPDGMGGSATDGIFTVTLSKASEIATVVNYDVTGTADGTDYSIPMSVTIAAGQTSATITVDVTDDALIEGSETVVVTLTGTDNSDITALSGSEVATVTITDEDTATVSIVATTAAGVDPDGMGGSATDGIFTVTLSKASEIATVVNYDVTGTADGTDYSIPMSVTIAAGQTSATITVDVTDDALIEGSETVVVTLTGTDNSDITALSGSEVATVTITDEDTATVSIVATTAAGVDPDGMGGSATDGIFTVTLSKASEIATVVNYDVTGTADGTDYSIPMSVTIAAGQTSATITVDVTDDALIEGSETVVVTLTGTDNSDITALSGSEVATVTITDEDTATVSIVATTAAGVDPDGMGGSATDGIFTVTLSKASEIATVVNYDVTGTADGTDYSIPMSVTIAAGQTSATITVDVTDDALIEGSETVVVTLTGTDNSDITALSGSEVATVTITDEDTATVSIVATTAAGVDPDGMGGSATDGIFTVTLSKASEIATVVNYDVTGTADGTDYSIPMSVTIAAGQTSATITVDVTDDALIEGSETVVVTLTGTDNSDITALSGSEVATVTITDEDTATVSIVATTAAGVDPDGMGGSATDGIFTVTLSKASEIATVVNYDVTGTADGTDYSIPMSVTIAAGQTSATITVDVTDDALIEGSETVVVTLTGTDNSDITALSGSEVATVTITDEDTATVSIVATTAAGVDPDGMGGSATDGIFTVTLSKASEIATVVNYDVTGTADGTDYSIPMSVTIAAGQTSATITVDVTDDALIEGSETVVVTLTGTDNSDITALSGSEVATVTITDEDTATVSIVATTAAGVDPDGMGGSATDGIFTVTLSKASEIATVVNYDVTGTADGTDYSIPMSVTIAAGQTSATITVDVTDDALIEGSETVVVTLTGTDNSDITALSGSEVATVTITDEDTATVSIVATTAAGVDPDGMGGSATDGIFTVTLSKASEIATVVNYDVTGTADGTDYSIPMSVTIAAGQTSATITVDVTDDALIEGSETVVVTLTGTDNSDITALSGSEVATVTITDEDTATVSIVATTAAGVDPDGMGGSATDGIFTVTLSKASEIATVVNYDVTGTADGTDYSIPMSVTIAAGQTSATITVDVTDDALIEGSETVVVTLTGTDNSDITALSGSEVATVTITDEDTATVSIVATTAAGVDPDGMGGSATDGIFTVTLSKASEIATVVNYDVTGTADGTDYSIPMSVTIAAGQTSATITVDVTDDALIEGSETVVVTLTGTDNSDITALSGSEVATVTITDEDTATVSIVATTAAGVDPDGMGGSATDGIFTVTLSKASEIATVVNYDVTGTADGTDYSIPMSVTIAAGQTSATITVDVTDDALIEGSETVVVTLTGTDNSDITALSGSEVATVTITDEDTATVSIVATTAAGVDPDGMGGSATDGIFTVTLSKASEIATVVNYDVTGTADGTDYSIPMSVTIAAGQTSATITVDVTDDALIEGSETVVVTLTGTDNSDITALSGSEVATVTITDEDTATVSIVATTAAGVDPDGMGGSATDGIFTVTLSKASEIATVVNYDVTGTADGTDYSIPMSVTIAAGQTSATITVDVTDDALIEGSETVVVTLTGTDNSDITALSGSEVATVTITDEDTATVSIVATTAAGVDPDGMGGSATDGIFTVTLSKASEIATVVNYDVTGTADGTDYSIPMSVTIAAGQTSATITVDVTDDALIEGSETVVVTLTGTDNSDITALSGSEVATVTITDEDTATVSIVATTAAGVDPDGMGGSATDGIFTVTLSKASEIATVVNYDVTGTADGTDYSIPMSVTIAAGQTSATITVDVTDDALIEGSETVVVTLTGTDNSDITALSGSEVATVTITDEDTATVSIVATTAAGVDPDGMGGSATDGIFTVTLSKASEIATVVNYDVTGTADGTDYSIPMSVTIAAGQTSATITVDVTDDALIEGSETVVVTLTGTDNSDITALSGSEVATVTITDEDTATVSIVATTAAGVDPDGMGGSATDGIFTVTLSKASEIATVVNYDVTGTADGTDYSIPMSVTIAAGQTSATITVDVTDDALIEGSETVVVTLTGTDNSDITALSGSEVATVTITDEDTATVSIVATTAAGVDPDGMGGSATDGIFTVTLSKASEIATVVNYDVTGTADGTDYSIPMSVTIAAGQTSATITVDVTDDALIEGSETVVVTLTGTDNSDITALSGSEVATVTITDEDTATVSIVATTAAGVDPDGMGGSATDGIFTVTLSKASEIATVVNYDVTGTADGTDYSIPMSVTIAAGQTSATITVDVTDDALIEGSETVVVTLTGTDNSDITALSGSEVATVTITDEDTATVSIVATTAAGVDPDGMGGSATDGIFTVTLSKASEIATVVNYDVTGTADGTDYSIPMSVTIAAGQTSATITVDVTDDALIEGSETVVVTLTGTDNSDITALSGSEVATVTITDEDTATVSIVATTAAGVDPDGMGGSATDGIFTVTLSKASEIATVVNYDVTGTADGTDYSIPMSVTIAAGQTSATITVDVTDDALIEGSETVVVTLTGTDNSDITALSGSEVATVTITDEDTATVSIVATTAAGVDPDGMGGSATDGIFTVTLSKASEIATVVNYDVTGTADGTDYSIPMSVTIAAGQTSATITVDVTDDALIEGSETVVVTLTGTDNSDITALSGSEVATVTITDEDTATVSIVATTAAGVDPDGMGGSATDGIFTVTLSKASEIATVVNYDVTGTADGTDYSIPMSVTIAAGQTSATITVDVTDDALIEGSETVVVTLTGTDNSDITALSGSEVATVTITDEDTATVSIVATTAAGVDPDGMGGSATDGIFTVTLSKASEIATVVNYDVTGTADGTDYSIPMSVTIAAGQTSATITVDVTDDALIEGSETVVVTLTGTDNSDITALSGSEVATVTITDEDTATVSIVATTAAGVDPDGMGGSATDGIFTVTLSKASEIATVVNYDVTGTADGTDYSIPMSVTIAAGQTSATITVDVTDDALIEGSETVVVTLTGTDNSDITALSGSEVATVTITDEDTATVSIVATTAAGVDPDGMGGSATDGIFTVTLSKASEIATVVNYDVTGTADGTDYSIPMSVTIAAGQTSATITVDVTDDALIEGSETVVVTLTGTDNSDITALSGSEVATVTITDEDTATVSIVATTAAGVDPDGMGGSATDGIFTVTLSKASEIATVVNYDVTGTADGTDYSIPMSVTIAAGQTSATITVDVTDDALIEGSETVVVTLTGTDNSDITALSGSEVATVTITDEDTATVSIVATTAAGVDPDGMGGSATDGIFTVTLSKASEIATVVNYDVTGTADGTDYSIPMSVTIAAGQTSATITVDVTDDALIEGSETVVVTLTGTDNSDITALSGSEVATVTITDEDTATVSIVATTAAGVDPDGMGGSATDGIFTVTLSKASEIATVVNYDVTGTADGTDYSIPMSVTIAAGQTSATITVDVTDDALIEGSETVVVTLTGTDNSDITALSGSEVATVTITDEDTATVSIVATTAAGVDPDGMGGSATDGIFTVTLSKASEIATVVNYDVTGTADGTDYSIPMSVTIAAGQTSATITVDVTDDALIEGSETVVVTLTGTDNSDITALSGSEVATVTITDEDTATVSIVATTAAGVDPDGMGGSATDGIFTVTLSKASEIATVVNYDVTGTADGTDYSIPMSVTIAAGQTSATITVDVTDDALIEGSETVVVTLTGTDNSDITALSGSEVATVTITDEDTATVSIVATTAAGVDPDGMGGSATDGIFTVTLSKASEIATVVNYDVTGTADGTDYSIPMSVTIAAGQTSATITVDVTDDALIEGSETVVVTLTGTDNSDITALSGSEVATVTITDEDTATVSIVATTAAGVDPDGMGGSATDGIFTVTLSKASEIATVVNYDVTGTADGTDYSIPMSVTIAAGQTSATITVDVTDDALIEGSETVVVTLTGTDNSDITALSGSEVATVTITDEDTATVSIVATTAAGVDPDGMGGSATDGIFTVTLSKASEIATVVNYDVTGTADGTDYSIPMSVTIAAGQTSATITVDVTDDALIEGSETVVVTLTGTDNSDITALSGSEVATVTITDEDTATVSIVATTAAGVDPDGMGGSATDGIFTVTLSKASEIATVVNYDVTGTADGTDYSIPMSVTIAAGQTSATITVDVTDDALIEGSETVVVTLTGTDNSDITALSGSEVATVTITDEDTATVSIVATTAAGVDPDGMGGSATDGIFTVTLSKASEIATVVNYDVTGTADGTDYSIPMSVTIAAGQTSATITVDVTDDALIEGSETVVVTLTGTDNSDITALSGSEVATVTITDEDTATVSIVATTAAGVDPDGMGGSATDGIFTVTLSKASEIATVVNYDVTGTADGTDYSIPMSVTIAAGQTSATITVDVTDDALIEGSETVVVTLTGTDNSDITALSGSEVATVTITDEDTATVSIVATTAAGVDPDGMGGSATDGIFTVTLSKASEIATVVNYDVTGTADGTDYSIPMSVTIAAGQTSATITVDVTDDALIEGSETVVVTLTGTDNSDITALSGSEVATVTITDEDTATVSIVATTAAGVDPDGMGGSATDGIFTVTLSKASEIATVVNYDVTGTADGTDYSIPMSVTIAAGQTSATITVDVTDDALIEGSETVVVTLTGTDNSDITALSGSEVATVTITDEDTATVSIVATTAAGVDPDGMGGSATDGIFTVTLSKASEIATVVNYDVTGTADGTDYSIPMSVTIAAGQTSATITVDVTDDALIEGSETVVVTLTGTDNSDITALSGSEVATVTITDEDTATVSIVATTAAGVDPDGMGGSATDGIFTVTLSKASEIATVVNYDVTGTADGTDYSIPMSVTIAAGQTSATITVDVTDDALIEGSETVVVTLTGTDNSDITALSGSEVATVTITDEDTATVSIVATTAAGVDPDGMGGSATDGIFTVTLSKASEIATVVNYDVTGTADGTDYSIPMSVTIAAGQTSATITVDVTDDALIEGSETVVVTLTGTDNSDITALSGSEVATVTITDEDTATVSIVATTAAGVDPDGMGGSATDGIFTVTLSKASEIATVVNYDVTGTADGTDYSIPMSVTIAAGQTSATITVDVTDDALIEGSETVVVTLTGTDNSDITALSGSEVATVTITDEDTATVSIVATTAAGVDPDGMGGSATDGIFTVTLSKASEIATVVNYDVTGTADGTDYSIPMSVTIAAGQTSATITVDVTDDALIELDETVVVTLTGTNNSDITALSGSDVATVTITDNDFAMITNVELTDKAGAMNNRLNVGDVATVTVTFDNAVSVTGGPRLTLNIGGVSVQADYASGSGSDMLTFTYTILAGENDLTNGISIDADSLLLNGGTIKDTMVGKDAILTHVAVADNADYLVDTMVAAPVIVLNDDTGSSNSDGITNDGTVNVTNLEEGATWEYSLNGGTNWMNGNNGDPAGAAGAGSFVVPATSGTLAGGATVEVSNVQAGGQTQSSLSGSSAALPDIFYLDITTNVTASATAEVLFESGATTRGLTIYRQGTDLRISVGTGNDLDLNAPGVLEDGKRYGVFVELEAGRNVTFYVAELGANGEQPTIYTQVGTAVWTSDTNNWSGANGGGWGRRTNGTQGPAGAAFSGTINEGRFYNNKDFADVWTDGSPHEVLVRQTDAAGNVSVDSTTLTVSVEAQAANVPPVIFDLDGDGVEYSRGVMFDTDNDGTKEQTHAWVAADDGLLAYDKNADGQITDTDEIAFTSYLDGAKTDLEGLVAFDTNNNGLLDADDKEFNSFVIWQDKNQDGISDEGELISLADAGIASISLTSDGNRQQPVAGVLEHGQGVYTNTDGSTGVFADVSFDYTETTSNNEHPQVQVCWAAADDTIDLSNLLGDDLPTVANNSKFVSVEGAAATVLANGADAGNNVEQLATLSAASSTLGELIANQQLQVEEQ